MKLLFAIKSVDAPGGGAERVLSDVVAGLSKRDHTITVMTSDQVGGRSFYEFPESVEIVRCPAGSMDRPTSTKDGVRKVLAFRAAVRHRMPDVAIGFMHSTYLPLGVALIGTGIPVLASEHTVFQHYLERPLQRAMLRLAPFLVARIAVVSESVRSGYPNYLRECMAVIPNPVSTPGNRVEKVAIPGRMVILAVGRIDEAKDHRTLLSAFARLASSYPGWVLRIVGAGPLRPQLERQACQLGISDRVEWAGLIADVRAEYESAEIFAMPSRYESFGLATAEALGHSLPAIGFADCEGTSELIVDMYNGLLIGAGDRPTQFAKALERLMQSAALRAKLGSAGPVSIKKFAISAVCDRWEELLLAVSKQQARIPEVAT